LPCDKQPKHDHSGKPEILRDHFGR
jgi:hypothetical protein